MSIPIGEILAGLKSAQEAFSMIAPLTERGLALLAAEEAHRAAIADGSAARAALDASTGSFDARLEENRRLAEAERLRLIREAGGGNTTPPTPEIAPAPRTPAAAAPDPLMATLDEVRSTMLGIGMTLRGIDARLAKLEGAAVGGAVTVAVTEAPLVVPEPAPAPPVPTQPELAPLPLVPVEAPAPVDAPAQPAAPVEAAPAPIEAPPVAPAPAETPTP